MFRLAGVLFVGLLFAPCSPLSHAQDTFINKGLNEPYDSELGRSWPNGWEYFRFCDDFWSYPHHAPGNVREGTTAFNNVGKGIDGCTGGFAHDHYTEAGIFQTAEILGGRTYVFRIWTVIEQEAGTWEGNGQYFTPYIKVVEGEWTETIWEVAGAVGTSHTGYNEWKSGEFIITPSGSGMVPVTCFLVVRTNGTWTKVIFDDLTVEQYGPTIRPPASKVDAWGIYR